MLTCFSLKAHLKILLKTSIVTKRALTRQHLYHSAYRKDHNFNNLFSPAGLSLILDTLHLKILFMNKINDIYMK